MNKEEYLKRRAEIEKEAEAFIKDFDERHPEYVEWAKRQTTKHQESYELEVKDILNQLSSTSEEYNFALERILNLISETLEAERAKYIEALIWCSGSEDFQIEGKAREGWEKICQPLINPLDK